MTAERDRLAALLHDVAMEAYRQKRWAQAPWPTDMYGWLADRLIAAGVGFLRNFGTVTVSVNDIPEAVAIIKEAERRANDLDVERLARAMRKASTYTSTGHGHPPRVQNEMWLSGAIHSLDRIAAAYRNDERS